MFALLAEADKPFTPPEVLNEARSKLRYGQPFEFAVKYLIDPSGMTRQPEQPQQQGAVIPGAQVQHPILQGMGIPAGPNLPAMPGLPSVLPRLSLSETIAGTAQKPADQDER